MHCVAVVRFAAPTTIDIVMPTLWATFSVMHVARSWTRAMRSTVHRVTAASSFAAMMTSLLMAVVSAATHAALMAIARLTLTNMVFMSSSASISVNVLLTGVSFFSASGCLAAIFLFNVCSFVF
ncbi:hypothetical protein Rcae01_00657 [Novipirellula caenicola]|uniref:Uncharacterized protein n=1 Tax=Novipirellula caenicola TaxID=1536901 RepID=A0ABP9VJ26_9BACT